MTDMFSHLQSADDNPASREASGKYPSVSRVDGVIRIDAEAFDRDPGDIIETLREMSLVGTVVKPPTAKERILGFLQSTGKATLKRVSIRSQVTERYSRVLLKELMDEGLVGRERRSRSYHYFAV